MVVSNLFLEMSIVLFVALIIALFFYAIKQPLIISYIFTGLLISPIFLGFLKNTQSFEIFSSMGIAFLLFIVGLNLNLKLIKEVGVASLITGLGQIVFTSLFGFLFSVVLGYAIIPSILISIMLTFSSTIIIVKLLSDKGDIEKLYGKISMGFLIVQDLVAVIILIVLSSFLNSAGSDANIFLILLETVLFFCGGILFTFVFSKYVFPSFLKKISKSGELLFVFTITWCFGVAALFTAIGFSLEVGALLAGIALASSTYQYEISAKVRPLRDFFIIIFFIILGAQMIPAVSGIEGLGIFERMGVLFNTMKPAFLPAFLLSIFVLIGNPLIVLILMCAMRYSSRTGFLAGLTVAQISEFSLIIASLGLKAGLLKPIEVSMITLVGIITIALSTYMIMYGDKIYRFLSPILKKFERKDIRDKAKGIQGKEHEVLIFGHNRIGFSILNTMRKLKKQYLIVDSNPKVIEQLEEDGIDCVYGDGGDIEFVSEFNLKKVKFLISTIPEYDINVLLLENLKEKNPKGKVILTSYDIDEATELYKMGADYVIVPHLIGGHFVGSLIENTHNDLGKLLNEKINHMSELQDRKKYGHHFKEH